MHAWSKCKSMHSFYHDARNFDIAKRGTEPERDSHDRSQSLPRDGFGSAQEKTRNRLAKCGRRETQRTRRATKMGEQVSEH